MTDVNAWDKKDRTLVRIQKPDPNFIANFSKLVNSAPKTKEFPDEVIDIALSMFYKNLGNGCCDIENPYNGIMEMVTASQDPDSDKIPRCVLTRYLYIHPTKGDRVRTNLSLWVIKSWIRTDGDFGKIEFQNKEYNTHTVIKSRKFRQAVSQFATNLEGTVKFISNFSDTKIDTTKLNDIDKNGIYELNDEIDKNKLIIVELKRNIPQESIDEWVMNRYGEIPQRKLRNNVVKRKSNTKKKNQVDSDGFVKVGKKQGGTSKNKKDVQEVQEVQDEIGEILSDGEGNVDKDNVGDVSDGEGGEEQESEYDPFDEENKEKDVTDKKKKKLKKKKISKK